MIRCASVLMLLATGTVAPAILAQGPRQRLTLDSGTVVRLHWADTKPIKATLLAPLIQSTDTVRYCRYPSSACGSGSSNPLQSASIENLEQVEVRRHGRIGHGTLLGAGIGVIVGGFAIVMAEDVSERRVTTGRQAEAMATGVISLAGIGALLDLTGDRWTPP